MHYQCLQKFQVDMPEEITILKLAHLQMMRIAMMSMKTRKMLVMRGP